MLLAALGPVRGDGQLPEVCVIAALDERVITLSDMSILARAKDSDRVEAVTLLVDNLILTEVMTPAEDSLFGCTWNADACEPGSTHELKLWPRTGGATGPLTRHSWLCPECAPTGCLP